MTRNNIKYMFRNIISFGYYYTRIYKYIKSGNLTILMYHRVINDGSDEVNNTQPGMYVCTSSFARQMSFIKKHYVVVSFNKLLEMLDRNEMDARKQYCVISFDDGWRDNYDNAFPILKQHNIPASIFLATSYIGTDDWFWPEKINYLVGEIISRTSGKRIEEILKTNSVNDDVIYHIGYTIEKIKSNNKKQQELDILIEKLKNFPTLFIDNALSIICSSLNISIEDKRLILNWDEISEMSKHGISFGSHTCSHKILSNISCDEAYMELEKSMNILKNSNIDFTPVFCYPNGNYNNTIINLVKKCGYQAAISTKYGIEDTRDVNTYKMKRIGIHDDISSSDALFAFRLSGFN